MDREAFVHHFVVQVYREFFYNTVLHKFLNSLVDRRGPYSSRIGDLPVARPAVLLEDADNLMVLFIQRFPVHN